MPPSLLAAAMRRAPLFAPTPTPAAAALAAFIEGLEKAQTFDRQSVRQVAADQFSSDRIVTEVTSSIGIASNLGFAALKKSATRQ